MTQQATHHHRSKSKHSRQPRHHRHHHHHHHRHEARHHSDGDNTSSLPSDTADRGTEETSQDQTVPTISTWSEPVLDAHSNGRFQYQARVTPAGYQWVISGSDSGTNPQYLSRDINSHIVHNIGTATGGVVTYPTGSYAAQQGHHPYYPSSNVAAPLVSGGHEDCRPEDYNEAEEEEEERRKPRREKGVSKKSTGDHQDGGNDAGQSHHRSHHHHHHHHHHHPHRHRHRHRHHRSKSHEETTRRRPADRGHDHASYKEKANG